MLKSKRVLILLLIFIISSYFQSVITEAVDNNDDTNSNALYFPDGYEGIFIVINKTKNTLKIYLNNYDIYTFTVATGKDTTSLTPEGKLEIITKVREPWYLPKNIPGGDKKNPLGTRWLGLNVPNTGGYKYGIHGTNNPYSIGHRVSQGCIRMHNKDIEWLYRHIPLKTPVIITK